MIIKSPELSGFFVRSELEFLGREIDFRFMTSKQIAAEVIKGRDLYNKLFPPVSSWDRIKKPLTAALIIAAVAVGGAAVLAAKGTGVGTATAITTAAATGTTTAAAATAPTFALSFSAVQTAATGISAAGGLYTKVTGRAPPDDLMQAAHFIQSKDASDLIQRVAIDELNKQGAQIQRGDIETNNAISALIDAETRKYSDGLNELAALESNRLGISMGDKKTADTLQIVAVATPFILLFLASR